MRRRSLSTVLPEKVVTMQNERPYSRAVTLAIIFCGLAMAAVAQDSLQIGNTVCTSVAPGSTVTVPVYVRDTAGTPLGVDQGVANRIQSIAFQIFPTNASAIALDAAGRLQVSIAPAGVTAALGTPTFVNIPRNDSSFAYIVSYDAGSQPIPFTLNATPPGDLVANINVTLAPRTAPGTTIQLMLNRSETVTSLSNSGGSVTESAGRFLELVSGCVSVPAAAGAVTLGLSPAAPLVSSGSSVTVTVTIGTPQTVPTTITLASSNVAVAVVPPAVTIPTGASSATFEIGAAGPGSANVTASLPASLGGGSASVTATVTAGKRRRAVRS